MNTNLKSFLSEKNDGNYWTKRLRGELLFLEEATNTVGMQSENRFSEIEQLISDAIEENGTITKQTVLKIEENLKDFIPLCKKYNVIYAAHAHIDMNWEWGIEETVGTVIDTFRTMLNLLEEYPNYCFSQSQASVYNIIETYCPSMLEPIRKYIAEGRWEVTASTWVENDKNMSGTEAQLRQILYTKRYLSKLLSIKPESLDIDFEPDTFGHNANLPEIISSAGIKYLYHCRGYDGKCAYRFKAPSGAEILAYNEPNWYLGPVEYDGLTFVPAFCQNNFTSTALIVYGVGDHGGGPSRRDIERIQDMQTWPLLPTIRFGKIREYFDELEKSKDKLPVINHELNCVFTGCYTSQSRIKQANRYCEDRLYDSEALSVMAGRIGRSNVNISGFEKAWRRVLFNQFHDILPGSGVRETRDYAMGTAAEACSYALANANVAVQQINNAIDTSQFGILLDTEETAEGAGPGFSATKSSRKERLWAGSEYNVTSVGRSSGKVRPYTLYNTTQFRRKEVVELVLWDWNYEISDIAVVDGTGKECEFDIVEGRVPYWSHESIKIAFLSDVPAFGYATYYVINMPGRKIIPPKDEPRVHNMEDGRFIMENDKVCAQFESISMKLLSLQDKESGKYVVTEENPGACIYCIDESEVMPYNAWTIGNYGKSELINDTSFVNVKEIYKGETKQWIDYEINVRNSKLRIRVSLSENDTMLRYSFEIDWNDQAVPEVSTPQLRFRVPYAYKAEKIRYDIPGGYIDRNEAGHDVPAVLFASPISKTGNPLIITTDSKYGYRGAENYIDVNIIRSSYTPDLYPEVGIHRFEIGVGIAPNSNWVELWEMAMRFSHPIYCISNSTHKGVLPQAMKLIDIRGKATVISVKNCEDQPDNYLIRMIADRTHEAEVEIVDKNAITAIVTDTNENVISYSEIKDGSTSFTVPSGKIMSVGIVNSKKE